MANLGELCTRCNDSSLPPEVKELACKELREQLRDLLQSIYQVIPVAILTTDGFDATTVDHTTVTFAGHGPQVTGIISVRPDATSERVEGLITATWAETEPDGSSITLEPTLIGTSNRLSFNPSSPTNFHFLSQNGRLSRLQL